MGVSGLWAKKIPKGMIEQSENTKASSADNTVGKEAKNQQKGQLDFFMGRPVVPVYYSKPVPLRQQIKNNRSGPFFHDRMFDHTPIQELKKKVPD